MSKSKSTATAKKSKSTAAKPRTEKQVPLAMTPGQKAAETKRLAGTLSAAAIKAAALRVAAASGKTK